MGRTQPQTPPAAPSCITAPKPRGAQSCSHPKAAPGFIAGQWQSRRKPGPLPPALLKKETSEFGRRPRLKQSRPCAQHSSRSPARVNVAVPQLLQALAASGPTGLPHVPLSLLGQHGALRSAPQHWAAQPHPAVCQQLPVPCALRHGQTEQEGHNVMWVFVRPTKAS